MKTYLVAKACIVGRHWYRHVAIRVRAEVMSATVFAHREKHHRVLNISLYVDTIGLFRDDHGNP